MCRSRWLPLTTTTPNPNGSIVHLVGYGQSLWSIAIAYGVKIDEIRTQNGLATDSTDIYAGQKLVIHPAGFFQAPSATLPGKSTSQPETPTVSAPKKTSTPTATVASQITSSPELLDTPVPAEQSFNLILVGKWSASAGWFADPGWTGGGCLGIAYRFSEIITFKVEAGI